MTERMLIAKIHRNDAGRIELFARGHQFRDTILFDDSDLITVGLDPNSIANGQSLAVRFWAIWEPSEKLNRSGNPYKDVVTLEPIDKPATTTSVDSSSTVAELREIKNLLQYIAHLLEGQDIQPPEPPAPSEFDNITVTDTPPPAAPDPALSVEEARNRFYGLTADAITLGMESRQVNAMIDLANRESFTAALAELENLVERMKRDTALPVEQATRGKSKLFLS
jgi:hypothetical protein